MSLILDTRKGPMAYACGSEEAVLTLNVTHIAEANPYLGLDCGSSEAAIT